jgi:hypothetical protein
MENKDIILISHDSKDEELASELKFFLENIFLNVHVYVSGKDLRGGQTWVEQIKNRLKSSRIIITLLTTKSLNNNWVYFESGAGFADDKAIPLLADNLKPEDLPSPLNLLQARLLTNSGIKALIKDISTRLDSREPTNYSGINELIIKIEKLLRRESILILKEMLPKNKVAPNSEKQWIYQDNCLVHDYIIEKNSIAIDTYFYVDKFEIQLFGRPESEEYFFNTMCKAIGFLPLPFNHYERKGDRLIFEDFQSNERIETVVNSLTSLLKRIEEYKDKVDKV